MATLNYLKTAFMANKQLLPGLRVLQKFPRKCSSNFERLDGTNETMSEIKFKMMKSLGLDCGYNPHPKPREHLLPYEPKMEDLPPRSMQNSFTSAIIPLSVSKSLQDRYVATLGHVRLGRLMEDMDLFAVWVCHQHLKIPKLDPSVPLPYTFVTILVDKITFTDFTPHANQDIRLSGHVSWVGRSSMEIVVWLEQLEGDTYKKITRALFLMAARNANNTKSAPVNPLIPANENEKMILAGGEQRKERRKQLQSSSLLKVEPNAEEQKISHDLFVRTTRTDSMELNSRILPNNARWMGDTSIVSTMASFPENRNAHNTVFGGFLMRNALEISWVCACLYCGERPKLETICDISFQKPVNVSSFLKMNAHVVYTQDNYIQIMTVADIIEPSSGNQVTSNIFYYTYKAPSKVAEVLPRTYDETLWYIDGRRKLKYALKTE
ncbi:acyl-coenzyme A thioesterase 9, mitochondrial-like [Episyrphus balteatus]|uniref:acyl-coenzyme A thioesterase 9, mitochondrial-like n=1 Tax=Episyrphus balteatus TaxID=286459 RepID=UPI00248619C0|nr:acyl-coenzyme A thioesterase 9, mitochondrial-like [Episyrphus balteatus]